jgi:glycine/D-amino acid oxidase-like deaminating enzyme
MFGESIWSDGAPCAADSPLPGACDVAVVGAGYTGLATALGLARKGLHVHVLDKGRVGEGASSRNAGFCTISPPVSASTLLLRGKDWARATVVWFEQAVDAVEALTTELAPFAGDRIGFRRIGNLRLAETRAQVARLHSAAEALAACGSPRTLLSRDDIGIPGPHGFRAGLWDARSGILHPGRLHRALVSSCLAQGVGLSQEIEVDAIASSGDGVTLSGAGFTLRARAVVVATNGSSGRTLRPFSDFLVPVASYIAVTEPIPSSVELGRLACGAGASTTYRFPHYFRILEGRRLLFGGRAGLSWQTDLRGCAAWLHARAQTLLPGITVPPPAACWGGLLGFSNDKLPLLGRLDERRFYAMGCAGHGVPTSAGMARDLVVAVDAALRHRTLCTSMVAPFWREPAYAPHRWMRFAEPTLPLISAVFRALDAVDRIKDRGFQSPLGQSAMRRSA